MGKDKEIKARVKDRKGWAGEGGRDGTEGWNEGGIRDRREWKREGREWEDKGQGGA